MVRRLLLSENTISALIVGIGWSAASLALLLYPYPIAIANKADPPIFFILEVAIFEAAGFAFTALEIRRRFKTLYWWQVLAVAGAVGGSGALLAAFGLNQSFDNLLYSLYFFVHFMVAGGIGGFFAGLALRQSSSKAFNVWYIILNTLVWAFAPVIYLCTILPMSLIVFIMFRINISDVFSSIIFSCLVCLLTGFICARVMFQLVYYAQQGQFPQELEEHPEFISSAAPGETLHIIDSGEAVDEGVRRKLGL